ncbi:hypothetical protein IJI17_02140 [Candidatus Saccharibacteria bacterium]|nr:hypothetical protein [Achromobacter sp.]MBQ2649460.1 hypothetical protein [Achromobacter sp.]MBQ3839350.1 hypothetical protein [Fibrobacter sp.]MBQ6320998.1 hypothetical protein [Candidatus Saccharibacteria bacterium]
MRLIDADKLPRHGNRGGLVHWKDIENAPTISPDKAEAFVDEIIGYIFAYPDDDYMVMETLCRKLYKHGLIDKKDGEWTCNFIEPADTPQTDCEDCKHYDDVNGHCFFIGRCTYEPKEQTERRDHETD